MATKISDMATDSSITGVEYVPVLDGSTNKKALLSSVAAYTIDTLLAAPSATPTTGDIIVGYRSTDEKSFTLNAVSSYAVGYVWGAASAGSPALSSDTVLVNRSGTKYTLTVDNLKTYVTTGLQATMLDISALSTATLGTTDQLLVCQTTTAKKTTLASLETQLWTDFATYAAALTAATSVADADKLYILQSGVPKSVTATKLSDYVVAEILAADSLTADVLDALDTYVIALSAITSLTGTDTLYVLQGGTTQKKTTLADITNYVAGEIVDAPWTEVLASKYTATPASTSTITMSDTSDFQVGYPVRYAYNGTTYYGIVTAINANALLTIAGAPLSGIYDISSLYVGNPERVVVKEYFIDTPAQNAVQDIFSGVTYQRSRWEHADAYLVSFSATQGVVDTGASQGKLNVKVAGNLVSTNDSNKGLTLSGTAGTWVANSAVAVSTTAYDIVRGDAIDLRCTEAGTNGDGECLSVELVFVLE